jgi:hypothetical protein
MRDFKDGVNARGIPGGGLHNDNINYEKGELRKISMQNSTCKPSTVSKSNNSFFEIKLSSSNLEKNITPFHPDVKVVSERMERSSRCVLPR